MLLVNSEVMEHSEEDEVEDEELSSREIRDILEKWQEVSDFIKKRHPDKCSSERLVSLFNDNLAHFREILKRRRKQTSLDNYFVLRK